MSDSTSSGKAEAIDAEMDLGDLIEKIFNRKKKQAEEEKKKSLSLQIIPTIGRSPAVGLSFGAALSAVEYRERHDEAVSSITASASLARDKKFLLVSRSDITTDEEDWHFLGDWRFYDYREETHELGTAVSSDSSADIDFKWFRFRQSVLHRMGRDFELGAEYDMDYHFGMKPAHDAAANAVNIDPEGDSSISSGVALVGMFDSTDNRINAARGVYSRMAYRYYPDWLGSESDWQMLDAEVRLYLELPSHRRQVLAFWGLTQIVISGTAPYFDLPSNGWDTYGRTARGYRAGRFRGERWLYGEAEYRIELTQNGLVGAVGFVHLSSFGDDDRQILDTWFVGGGGGLRFKVDKRTGSNLALDIGLGEDGSSGFYLAFNEAF